MEALKSFPDNSYDLAIVDPPYGINAGKKHVGPGWVTRESKSWDFERPGINYFSELRRVSKNQIIWGRKLFCGFATGEYGMDILGQRAKKFLTGGWRISLDVF